MLANEPSSERAVSILAVLAALAFVAVTIAVAIAPLGHAGVATSPDLLAPTMSTMSPTVDTAIVAAQEPPPPVADESWRGECDGSRDDAKWPDMPVTLDVHVDRDGSMRATGTLAFIGRRTRADLRGTLWNDHYRLRGKMLEIDGLHTEWKLELVGTLAADRARGTFIEVYPAAVPGSERMCSFAFTR